MKNHHIIHEPNAPGVKGIYGSLLRVALFMILSLSCTNTHTKTGNNTGAASEVTSSKKFPGWERRIICNSEYQMVGDTLPEYLPDNDIQNFLDSSFFIGHSLLSGMANENYHANPGSFRFNYASKIGFSLLRNNFFKLISHADIEKINQNSGIKYIVFFLGNNDLNVDEQVSTNVKRFCNVLEKKIKLFPNKQIIIVGIAQAARDQTSAFYGVTTLADSFAIEFKKRVIDPNGSFSNCIYVPDFMQHFGIRYFNCREGIHPSDSEGYKSLTKAIVSYCIKNTTY